MNHLKLNVILCIISLKYFIDDEWEQSMTVNKKICFKSSPVLKKFV